MDNNIKNPKISVVMSVYNNAPYVEEAIQSILDQTYCHFEFLIVNDGSADNSAEIVKSFTDSRIRLIENEKNMGHTFCLNRAISEARGEYIARMDSDDISLPTRFSEQMAFMDNHQDVAVCGTWIKTVGDQPGYVNRYLTDPEDIRASLLFNTSLAHPTVMIRKSVLDEHNLRYSIALDRDENSEDYALWSEISEISKLANIPKVLLLYRIHKKSVSFIHSEKQRKSGSLVRRNLLSALGLSPSEEDMRIHNSTRPKENEKLMDFLEKEEKWLTKILRGNMKNQKYIKKSLEKVLYERWRAVCGLNASGNIQVWKKFYFSDLFDLGKKKRFIDASKIFAKSILSGWV